jgi:hypothetical protein
MNITDPQTNQTGAMKVSSDNWLAKDVPGSAEAQEFYKKMAQELDWAPSGFGNMMNRPDLAKAFAKLIAEGGKMQGMPVEQILRIGGDGTAGAGSVSGAQTPQGPSKAAVGTAAGTGLAGALGGKLGGIGALGGGLGGFGRKKKQEQAEEKPADKPADSSAAASAPIATGPLMEMTVDMSNFSTSGVDDSLFAIPAGFKQVEPDTGAQGKRK